MLANLIDSDPNLAIARGFGYLHSRVLVQREIELPGLTEQINDLDKKDAGSNTACRLYTAKHKEGWNPEQKDLSDTIQEKLNIYGMGLSRSFSSVDKQNKAELF
jgi:hypothetical protein